MKPKFRVNRIWCDQPVILTTSDWSLAQELKTCSEKELARYIAKIMILG